MTTKAQAADTIKIQEDRLDVLEGQSNTIREVIAELQKIIDAPAKMCKVDDCPETGQFVVVWVHNGRVWSRTYQRDGAKLEVYNEDGNAFTNCIDDKFPIDDDAVQKMYFVAE